MNPLAPFERWAITALAVLVIAGVFGGFMRERGYKAGAAATELSCAHKIATGDTRGTDPCALAVGASLTRYAQAEADAATAATAKQVALQNTIAAIDAQHAQELHDAQAKSDAVVAGLRDGALRLRRQWAGCESAAASVPSTAAGVGSPDATAEQRTASAAAIVRIGAEADAQIRALQAVIRADRSQP